MEYRLKPEIARRLMESVFIRLGVPQEDTPICADVLLASDLRGIESHGIGRLKMYYDRLRAKIQFPVTEITVLQDRKSAAVWDANHGMGQIAAYKAMQKALEKASLYGMGSVAVRNSTHFGIAGYYALMATRQDMIGMVFTNARPSVSPTFGVEPMLGTNPICFGAPSNLPFPFLFDAATSITQRGKLEVLERSGKSTPAGWAVDSQGNYCTDTRQLLQDLIKDKAACLPLGGADETFGGHKGYGLSAMVEILCAALQGGTFLKELSGMAGKEPYRLGHFFLAIDPDFFMGREECKKTTTAIMQALKDSQKTPGQETIYIAGEKEYFKELEIAQIGIPVNESLRKNILQMINELSIDDLELGF